LKSWFKTALAISVTISFRRRVEVVQKVEIDAEVMPVNREGLLGAERSAGATESAPLSTHPNQGFALQVGGRKAGALTS
jgi:hypothetical protein